VKPRPPELQREWTAFRSETKAEFDRARSSINRAMLTFNVTLALGLAGMIVAIVLKG